MISQAAETATANPWSTRAEELTKHAIRYLSNRTDAVGAYGNGPYCHKIENPGELPKRLRLHFTGRTIGGLYPCSKPDGGKWFTRFGVIDIDLKPDYPDQELRRKRNHQYAMRLMRKLESAGIVYLIEDSNGDGAYHIWFWLSESIPVPRMYAFLQSLVADAAEYGFGEFDKPDGTKGNDTPETFPKQAHPSGEGLGNFIRLPGKHHTYGHHSRFWGLGEWLSVEESVEAWLNLQANSSDLIPEITEEPPPPPKPKQAKVTADGEYQTLGDLAEATIERETWSEILTAAGWKLHSQNGAESTWTRPGKDHGVSATLNHAGNNLFTVFTTSTAGLHQNGGTHESYGKWRFYCWSNSFGDRQIDAAKAYLPAAAVEAFEAQSKARWLEEQRATNGVDLSGIVDDSPLKHGANRANVDKSPERKKILRDHFIPFPVDELPKVLSRFVREVSESVGCDPAFPGMAVLCVCAGSIGTSRQLRVKHGWFVPPVIWGLLVGESGVQKSPALSLALKPLHHRQQKEAELHECEKVEFEAASRAYKRDLKAWERTQEGPEPQAPTQPIRRRCLVKDLTIEALAPILNDNPRGLLLARDELSGWLSSFDRYAKSGGTSSDVAHWLEIYSCDPMLVDRKTGAQFIYVKRPCASLVGGIQPGILSRCLTSEHKENGLQSRLMMVYPPHRIKKWRDAEIRDSVQTAYSDCVRDLFGLQHNENSGDLCPATLHMSPEALELFKQYVNATGAEQSAMQGHRASQWSKLEEIPARLAIVLHSVEQVTSGVPDPWSVSGSVMQSAIRLAEWFKDETLRIERLLTVDDDIRELHHLVQWLQNHGGRITARDLRRHRRDIDSTEAADMLLIRLVDAGFGTWSGTHKSREFILSDL